MSDSFVSTFNARFDDGLCPICNLDYGGNWVHHIVGVTHIRKCKIEFVIWSEEDRECAVVIGANYNFLQDGEADKLSTAGISTVQHLVTKTQNNVTKFLSWPSKPHIAVVQFSESNALAPLFTGYDFKTPQTSFVSPEHKFQAMRMGGFADILLEELLPSEAYLPRGSAAACVSTSSAVPDSDAVENLSLEVLDLSDRDDGNGNRHNSTIWLDDESPILEVDSANDSSLSKIN